MAELPLEILETDEQSVMVEAAKTDDAQGIVNVQTQTWLATYPNTELGITEEDVRVRIEGEQGEKIPEKIERWRSSLENPSAQRTAFVVHQDGEVIAFVAPGIISDQRRIGAIYVLPKAQSKGIGYKLLQRAIEWHGRDEDIFLHVASYNQNAIDFYERNGFVKTNQEVIGSAGQLRDGKVIPEVEMVLKANRS